jgi:hypothetical protein
VNHIISIEHFLKVKSHYRYRMFSQGQTILSLQNILPRSNLIISTKHFTKVKPHYFYKMFSQGQTSISLQNIFPRSNLNITTKHFIKVKPHYLYPRSNLIISTKCFPKVKPHYFYKTLSQGRTSLSLWNFFPRMKKHFPKVKHLFKTLPQGQTIS